MTAEQLTGEAAAVATAQTAPVVREGAEPALPARERDEQGAPERHRDPAVPAERADQPGERGAPAHETRDQGGPTVTGTETQSELDAAPDRLIADRAADGDTAAFATLVRRYTPMMRAYARRILGSTADVDDVVQESFITAWEQLPGVEHPERVKSWLMRIAGRKAIDGVRATRQHVDVTKLDVPAPANTTPPRQVEARAGVAALRAALDSLPDAQRQCWVLREIGGYTYDEAAEVLGVPVSTVRGLLARARKHLLVRMEQWR